MATTEDRLRAFAQGIGLEFKALILKMGDLTALTTTNKTTLVAAINEIVANAIAGGSVTIDDTAGDGTVDKVWSANKVHDAIVEAMATVKAELINGAPELLNTFKELADEMALDKTFAAALATGLGNRVRVDETQTFTLLQKSTGRDNIGAASAADLSDLSNAIGATDVDYVAIFQTAKNS